MSIRRSNRLMYRFEEAAQDEAMDDPQDKARDKARHLPPLPGEAKAEPQFHQPKSTRMRRTSLKSRLMPPRSQGVEPATTASSKLCHHRRPTSRR